MKHPANLLTLARLLGALLLLPLRPLTPAFWGVYLLCGLTDMLDGPLARHTHTQSKTGERLDSAADTVFTAVCLLRLLPLAQLPGWIWLWVAGVGAVKAACLLCWARRGGQTSLHTLPNKATGFLLFLLPLTLTTPLFLPLTTLTCALATLAAAQDAWGLCKRE